MIMHEKEHVSASCILHNRSKLFTTLIQLEQHMDLGYCTKKSKSTVFSKRQLTVVAITSHTLYFCELPVVPHFSPKFISRFLPVRTPTSCTSALTLFTNSHVLNKLRLHLL